MSIAPHTEDVFLTSDPLQTERLITGRRKLIRELAVSVYNTEIKVPKNFETDFSSIPTLWSFIVRWSRVDLAGVVHDRLYFTGEYTRRQADKIWRLVANAGDHRANLFQAWVCWLFLRAFGWWAWRCHRKNNQK